MRCAFAEQQLMSASWLDQAHRRSRWCQPQSMNSTSKQSSFLSVISLDSNERAGFSSYSRRKQTISVVSFRTKTSRKASRSSSAGLLIRSRKAQLHTGSKRAAWWDGAFHRPCPSMEVSGVLRQVCVDDSVIICNIYHSKFIQTDPHDAGMSHFIKIFISLKYSAIESEKKLSLILKALVTASKKCFFFFWGGGSKDRLLPPAFSISAEMRPTMIWTRGPPHPGGVIASTVTWSREAAGPSHWPASSIAPSGWTRLLWAAAVGWKLPSYFPPHAWSLQTRVRTRYCGNLFNPIK